MTTVDVDIATLARRDEFDSGKIQRDVLTGLSDVISNDTIGEFDVDDSSVTLSVQESVIGIYVHCATS